MKNPWDTPDDRLQRIATRLVSSYIIIGIPCAMVVYAVGLWEVLKWLRG